MSLLGDIGNNIYNGASGAASIGMRDAGHAINLGQNLITGQGLHGNNDSNWGSALVNAAHNSGYNPAPIMNLASQGTMPQAGTPKTQISPNSTSVQGSIYGGGGSGGGGGSYNPAAAQAAAQRSQGIDTIYSALGRIPNQLDIALGNIGNQFNQNLNELNSAKNSAHAQYSTGTTQAGQSLQTNKNQIADQSSSGLHGLMRILGANGAGGSSDVGNFSVVNN